MGWFKRCFKGIWAVVTGALALVLWVLWERGKQRRYKEKVDAIHRDADKAVEEVSTMVREADGAALYKRARNRIARGGTR